LTVKGRKKDAQKALTDALYAIDKGTHIDPSKESVDECLESWLEG
jgi:hypothetical protein